MEEHSTCKVTDAEDGENMKVGYGLDVQIGEQQLGFGMSEQHGAGS
mgnify:CR=1 FL=1